MTCCRGHTRTSGSGAAMRELAPPASSCARCGKRIAKVLDEDEDRTDFVRSAVERAEAAREEVVRMHATRRARHRPTFN
jgi:hypothetical protein